MGNQSTTATDDAESALPDNGTNKETKDGVGAAEKDPPVKKLSLEEKLEADLQEWKTIYTNGVTGVCQPIVRQLQLEAALSNIQLPLSDLPSAEEESNSQLNGAGATDAKLVDKCLQVLVAMPSKKSYIQEDRSTEKDMQTFARMFNLAIFIVDASNQQMWQLKQEKRFTKRSKRNDSDSDTDEEDKLSTEIFEHEDDDKVSIARKVIRESLVFLSEVGKLTTSDGTDKWHGMTDALKQARVIDSVVRLVQGNPSHNTFVFWGLNALYHCCRDDAKNDWEDIETMKRAGGLTMVETLRSTCSEDPAMLVHVQLLYTMMTMKDDDHENLLDDSLATTAQRVIEPSPGFGTNRIVPRQNDY